MSSSESDSNSSYKRGKKRNRSRSRSHKHKKKSRNNHSTKSNERSSVRHSPYRSCKDTHQLKSSRDLSPKHKSSREKSSKHKLFKKSPMRRSPHVKHSRDSSASGSSRSKNKKSKYKVEKIDTKEQIKRALQAAASVDDQLRQNSVAKYGEHDFMLQQQRAEQINDIENEDFFQSDFKSSRSEIPMPKGSQVDASHASAMFGNYAWKDDVSQLKNKDESVNEIIQMMHPNLLENADQKFEKWKEKLFLMRKIFLKSNKGQLPWQIQ